MSSLDGASAALFSSRSPDLAEDDLEILAARFEPVRLVPGETLVEEGRPSDAIWLLGSGSVSVSFRGPNGPVKILDLGRGAWVGEISFLDCGSPSATAVVRAPGMAFRLRRAALSELMESAPRVGSRFLRTLQRDLAARLREWDRQFLRRPRSPERGLFSLLFGARA
jgi:CRP-like cAMP-binding protein